MRLFLTAHALQFRFEFSNFRFRNDARLRLLRKIAHPFAVSVVAEDALTFDPQP